MNTPVSAFAKLSQLFAIINAKNAGSVSVSTWALAAYSNIARIATVLLNIVTFDWSLMTLYCSSFLLNCSIVAACILYGNEEKSVAVQTENDEKDVQTTRTVKKVRKAD